MNRIDAIASSGMRAASQALRASAHNLANVQTEDFRREKVLQTAEAQGGVRATPTRADAAGASIEADLIAQLQARNAFLANLAVFRSGPRGMGSILDLYA